MSISHYIDGIPNSHRGCVTPKVLQNLKKQCEGDMEYVDGYDELPPDWQEKVKTAIEQEHVDDEDWKGVSTLNLLPTSKLGGQLPTERTLRMSFPWVIDALYRGNPWLRPQQDPEYNRPGMTGFGPRSPKKKKAAAAVSFFCFYSCEMVHFAHEL